MNEEVLQDLFNRAVSKGYNKSIEEFTVLLSQIGRASCRERV